MGTRSTWLEIDTTYAVSSVRAWETAQPVGTNGASGTRVTGWPETDRQALCE